MPNDSKFIDYSVILADLYAKRAGIDAAIQGVIAASGSYIHTESNSGSSSFSPSGNGDRQPTELPRGAFLGKSLPAAVKLYLSAVMKKQTIKEITVALRDGGVETTSPNFENVITGCLNRMKTNGEILRFKDGWGLPEFYPEHLRRSLSQAGATKSKIPGKKATKKAKKPSKPAKVNPSPKPESTDGLAQKIGAFLNTSAGIFFTPQEIASAIPGAKSNVVSLMMGRLIKKPGFEKSAEGKYRADFSNVREMPKAV
ncbi:MAG TPA: hypothetical protein VGG56_04685 [Terracidiphilus sp.]|jgi:hypothetical protein